MRLLCGRRSLAQRGTAAGRAVREVLASRGFIAVDGAGGDELVAARRGPGVTAPNGSHIRRPNVTNL